jgi:hypothetical protein
MLFIILRPNTELSRPPKGNRLELLVLPERSEGGTSDYMVSRLYKT